MRPNTLRKYRSLRDRYNELYSQGLRSEVVEARLSEEYYMTPRSIRAAIHQLHQYEAKPTQK